MTINMICIYFLLRGEVNVVGSYVLKVLSYGLIIGFQHYNYNANKAFFYFRNAGYGIDKLYLYALTCDALAYGVLLSLLKLFKYWVSVF
ncbi:hypothetical protein SAMN05192574_11463 [Mucilaginibacter gossypiicola]|uniref:Uncharacterized protein n=2 Tax=Mucilaginibacter gossypiicola TaxID=551995 RepID=A0A1H8T1A1_9SPHI|nr:hypothetical protein SAMN05192574_11463 [Mucilaginibacter gossypiicola]